MIYTLSRVVVDEDDDDDDGRRDCVVPMFDVYFHYTQSTLSLLQ